MLKKLLLSLVLICIFLPSCSQESDRREFYYFCNEEYKLSTCLDVGNELPNAHAYMSQFVSKVDYTKYFDVKNSVLELRVYVDDRNIPHGYGYIKLFDINGIELINIDVNEYRSFQLDYQWGAFLYKDFSNEERIYTFAKTSVRFRYYYHLPDENKDILITFNYDLSKMYDYPEEFKRFSWLG